MTVLGDNLKEFTRFLHTCLRVGTTNTSIAGILAVLEKCSILMEFVTREKRYHYLLASEDCKDRMIATKMLADYWELLTYLDVITVTTNRERELGLSDLEKKEQKIEKICQELYMSCKEVMEVDSYRGEPPEENPRNDSEERIILACQAWTPCVEPLAEYREWW